MGPYHLYTDTNMQPPMPHHLHTDTHTTTTECITPTIMASTDTHTPLLILPPLLHSLLIIIFSNVRPNLNPNMDTTTSHTPTPTTTLTTTTTTTSTELVIILTPPTIHMLINTPYQDTSFKDARDLA